MQVTKKNSKRGIYYITDCYCPKCDERGEMTLLDYSLAGEVLTCRVCGYESDWRPLLDSDVCTNFAHPNAPPQAETPKPVRFDSDTETLAEAALATIRFPIAYTDWLKCGFALASEFGARRAAEMMFRYSPPTKQGETIEDYENVFSKSDGRVGIGSLFQIAKQHGFSFPTTRPQGEPSALNGKSPTNDLTSYPLQTLNGHTPADESDLDDETELGESETETPDVAFPELPDGLLKQVYDHIIQHDVPKEFAITGTLVLLSSVIGDKVGLQFGNDMIFCNDFFVQIGKSGAGKSSTSQIVCSLLRKVDARILKIDGKSSELFYANVVTARGLVDQIRCESDVERMEREAAARAAEKKKAPVPIQRTPQTSGLWVIDEFVMLLQSFKREFNAELNPFLLSLWDNRPMSFQTKTDGRFEVPQTGVVMLGNSTPKRFVSALPEHARSDGFAQRMLIVKSNEPRRKTMLEVIAETRPDESDALCERLLNFFSYCAKRPPVRFLSESVEVEKEFVQRYQSHDENVDAFLKRLNVRLLKFSLIVGVCKAFEARAKEIVIDARTMEQASVLLDFFVKHTLSFWSESAFDAEKPIDAIGRTKQKILSVLREKFNGEAKRKTLRDYSNAGNQLFEKALAELVENRKVRIEEREIRGQKTVFVTLSSKFTSPFYFTLENKHDRNTSETTKGEKAHKKGEVTLTSPLLHPTSPFEINTTETQVKQQKAQKGEVKKGEVNAFSEPTSPEPAAVVPESKPEPMPVPPPVPEPTANDIERLAMEVFETLKSRYAGQLFTRAELRALLNEMCGANADVVGRVLFPKHILQIVSTNKMCFADETLRPHIWQGVKPIGNGELPPF